MCSAAIKPIYFPLMMVSNRRSFVDEREDIQKKAFTKWINNQLANVSRYLFISRDHDIHGAHYF